MRKKVVSFLICSYLHMFGCCSWLVPLQSLGLFRNWTVTLLADQRLVDVRNDTTTSNGRLDECVQLFVSSDGQLQVTGSDTLHLQVLGRVACQLQNLSSQVLEDGCGVDGSGGADTSVAGGPVLRVPVDPAHGELEPRPAGPRLRLPLHLAALPAPRHGVLAARV